MSWVQNKKIITDYLTSIGYREIQDALTNEEVSNAYAHRAFTLRPTNRINTTSTARGMLVNSAALVVNYMVDDTQTYDMLYDEFMGLISGILSNNRSYTIAIQPKYEQTVSSNNRIIEASVSFDLGVTIIC